MCASAPRARCRKKPQEGLGLPGAAVTGSCEPACAAGN